MFRVLGSIEVLGPSGPIPLGGPKQRLLVAVLVAHRRSVASVDLLADALWGDTPPETARTTLQTHCSRLRRAAAAVGAELAHRPPGYVLEVDRSLVDADRFEDALESARAEVDSDPAAAVELLDEALDLWRGPAFAEFADAQWATGAAVHLNELRTMAHEERIEARLGLGEHAGVIGEIEALVAAHPLRERLWCQLMVALHRSGRQAEALRAAQAFRARIGDELGLEPSEALRALETAVATDDATVRAPPGPIRTRSGPTHWTTELVGRDGDLAGLARVMTKVHLVTLTGTGGVGKSRLAGELDVREGASFRDGVRMVELAAVRDDSAVVTAVAASLDVERRPERSLEASVTEVLAPLRLLLVLDNCEHVIAAVGRLVAEILRWCPAVHVLATSREPIGLPGEAVWPVVPLAVPPSPSSTFDEIAASPAVQVFTSRAAEASPSFALSESAAPAVAELCIGLDGLPLALELAAGRMAAMSPRQLADRLHARFQLLGTSAARDPRHQRLLDVVRWSFELLSEDEQRLFAHLSVFAGGFELEAAEQICGTPRQDPSSVAVGLGALVDKSLVVAEHTDDRARYRQLETLRQYGAERLDERPEAAEVRRSHAAAFVRLAERGAEGLDGPDEAEWSAQLDRDLGNLRVAMSRALGTDDVDTALRLCTQAREYAFRRIRYEIVDWAQDAVALGETSGHRLLPDAVAMVAYGHFVRGELDAAIEIAQRAGEHREALGVDSSGLAERVLGNALIFRGEQDDALASVAELVRVARASDRPAAVAHGLYMHSVGHTSIGDPASGDALATEALDAARRAGSPTALAQACYAAGLAAEHRHGEDALDLLERSVSLAGSVGNRWMRAFAMTEVMWLRARRGETALALAGYRDVVETWYRGGDWANQWLSLRQLAGVLAGVGQDEDAAVLFGAVDAAGATAALPLARSDADELAEAAMALEQRLGRDATREARRRGSAMRDDAVVATALAAIDKQGGS